MLKPSFMSPVYIFAPLSSTLNYFDRLFCGLIPQDALDEIIHFTLCSYLNHECYTLLVLNMQYPKVNFVDITPIGKRVVAMACVI